MQVVDPTQLKQIIAKSTDFFGDQKKYKPFDKDIQPQFFKDITDV